MVEFHVLFLSKKGIFSPYIRDNSLICDGFSSHINKNLDFCCTCVYPKKLIWFTCVFPHVNTLSNLPEDVSNAPYFELLLNQ